jgi:cob(I)alamin adenosyltransferase
MKIYTKTGDKGLTGLYGGARVWKDDPRVEAYGTIDELNAALGASIAHCRHNDVSTCLTHVQRDLFVAGADLASPQGDDNVSKPGLPISNHVTLRN